MRAGAVFVKEVPGFRLTGKRNQDADYEVECTCGYSRIGFQDYWDMRAFISTHAARHMLKAVSK